MVMVRIDWGLMLVLKSVKSLNLVLNLTVEGLKILDAGSTPAACTNF